MKYVDTVNILDCRTHLGGRAKETVLHGGRERAISPAGRHPWAQWCPQPEEGKEDHGETGASAHLCRWHGNCCYSKRVLIQLQSSQPLLPSTLALEAGTLLLEAGAATAQET